MLVAIFVWFSKDLPTPNKVVRIEGYASQNFDRNGELIYQVYRDANRTPVTWDEIPDTLKNATVAVEDKIFINTRALTHWHRLELLKMYSIFTN
jgi:membrane peptidoglycan carboxypeptidase